MPTGAFSRPRRALAIGLAGLVTVAVAVAIVVAAGGGKKHVATVSGLSGSEKIPFFQDARVVKRLHDLGIDVQVESVPSREIAKSDLTKYDFAFPSGVPAALAIRKRFKTLAPYAAFYTPMVVATFKPIVGILIRNRIAAYRDGTYTLDIAKYLDLVRRGAHWTELKGSRAYPVDKSVVITSADVRSANSAAMYLSMASYVANGDSAVASRAEADKVLPLMMRLFFAQGFVAPTSDEPFNDYLSIGIGKSPLVMVYESQFVARAALRDGSIRPDMVLMYPTPTVLSKHTFIPLTANGDKLGKALTTDAKLQQLEVEYGFRTPNAAAFERFTSSHGVHVPASIVNAVDPPSYETLQYMITRIERAYQAQGSTP